MAQDNIFGKLEVGWLDNLPNFKTAENILSLTYLSWNFMTREKFLQIFLWHYFCVAEGAALKP